jgi:hypothetical protein
MSSAAGSLVVFACVFGGALLGLFLRTVLPEQHLNADSKSTVNLGMGLIGTMAALVLGLVVSAAASSYFSERDELTQVSSRLILLDRILAHYGPEANEVRKELRGNVAATLDRVWPEERSHDSHVAAPTNFGAESLYEQIQQLSAQNDIQRSLKNAALGIALEIGKTRWLMFEQQTSPIPAAFMAIVVLWLTIVFTSFGLFAPRNGTVIVTLFLGALSVAGAMLLIAELYTPFEGLIRLSSAPVRNALELMGK